MHKLTAFTTSEKVEIYNAGIEYGTVCGEHLFHIDEWDEVMGSYSTWEVACMTFYGDFNPGKAEYFTFDGYGNLKSFDEFEIEYYLDDYADELKKTLKEMDY